MADASSAQKHVLHARGRGDYLGVRGPFDLLRTPGSADSLILFRNSDILRNRRRRRRPALARHAEGCLETRLAVRDTARRAIKSRGKNPAQISAAAETDQIALAD
jgi:hypothetical protein